MLFGIDSSIDELNSKTDGGASAPNSLLNTNDLDEVTTPGFYYWAGGYGPQNNPYNSSAISGGMLVCRAANGYYMQFVFSAHNSIYDSRIYSRVYRDSAWGEWRYFSIAD